jgi:two-component system, CitB family, sensor kinase
MIRRVSLAGQLLILQLGIVLVVLVAVSAVSVAQAQAGFREVQGRRVLSVAERAAASDIVREHLPDPAWRNRIAAVVDGYRGESVGDHALVAGTDRRVLASTEPSQVGRLLDLHGSNVLQGRAWEGVAIEDGVRSVVAHTPVMDDRSATMLGFVVVGANTPGVWDSLAGAVPNLLTYLGVASVLGVAGSLLLARRVKRQTLGLEPRAITRLAEHRDTMLHGIREGWSASTPGTGSRWSTTRPCACSTCPPTASAGPSRTSGSTGASTRSSPARPRARTRSCCSGSAS